ncbi:phage tail protein [Enterococcus thailandicus]
MATELGQAYVQIIPSAKGISGAISKQLDPEASSAGKSAGLKIGTGLKVAAVAAVAAVGATLGKTISASLTEGAKLQQSLGGIETLFKGSANKVKKYADEAYRTSGLSANAYMENVTSFSASLLQSVGGDTEKAADVANMAMIDMSDNANKMGTDMGDIQNAYQGFAKQNYTMLDNLKLGYGGTKEEMARLLADAEKLTGVKYDISNLSDVYNAIHAIQENLDITGTTAKEAAETFSGSFAAMKASLSNVLGKMALGQDIKPSLNQLAETTATFLFGNFIPMVGNILKALPGAIVTFIKASIPYVKSAFNDLLRSLNLDGLANEMIRFFEPVISFLKKLNFKQTIVGIGGVGAALGLIKFPSSLKLLSSTGKLLGTIFSSLVGVFGRVGASISGGLMASLSKVTKPLVSLISNSKSASLVAKALGLAFTGLTGPVGIVIGAITALSAVFGVGGLVGDLDKLLSAFSQFADNVLVAAPVVGEAIGKIILGLSTGIAKALPLVALAAVQLITAFTTSMLLLIPTIVLSATQIIVAFLAAFTVALPQIILAGTNLINSLLQGITLAIPSLVANTAVLITTWLTSLNAYLPMILQAGFNLLITFLQGIANNIGQVAQQALNIIINFANVIIQNMPTIVNTAVNLMVSFLNALASRMPDIIQSAVTLIVNFVNGIANNLDQIINAAVNLIVKFLSGIANKIPDIVNAAMGLVDAMVRGVIDAQDRLMNAAITLINGFAENIRNRKGDIRDAALNLLDAIVGVFVPDSLYDTGKNLIQGLINGIGSMVDSVASKISEVAGNIKGRIQSALGIHSPSRWMRDMIGQNMMLGWQIGIDKNAKYPTTAVVNAGNAIKDNLNSSFKNAKNTMDSLKNIVGGSINTNFLQSDELNPEVAFATSTMKMQNAELSRANQDEIAPVTINNGGLMDGATFYVREEADIRKLAIELDKLSTERALQKGYRRV